MSTDLGRIVPPGWAGATLGDVLSVLRGVTYKGDEARKTPAEGFLPVLRATNIDEHLNFEELVYVPERYVSEQQLLRPGDIVIAASSGSRSVVGKAAPLKQSWVGSFGAFCYALRPLHGVDPAFLALFLRSKEYRDRVSELAAGVNINNLRREHIESTPVRLPPLPEQHRIVATIEQQFTRLDAAVADLQRARAKLKRYRAAVLAAACSGRLVPTEAELTRTAGNNYERANEFLERVLTERRAAVPANSRPPVPADTYDLPEVPEGWVLASMDELTTRITSGSRDWSRYYGRGSGTFLMAQNVRPGVLDLSFRQSVDPPPDSRDRARSQVLAGDLLVTIVGANTGDLCHVPTELSEHFVCQSVALMRPVDAALSPFLSLYMNSEENGQRQYRRYIYGQGRPHLSFDQLKMTAVLLPPVAEQHRIVAEVERRLSVVDEMEATVAANLKRAERMRQAILRRAFAGQLVPQDPNDERASVPASPI